LDDAINRLPDKYRQPIVLCCLEGKSNEEAARELGCAVGTIGTRLSRARERLRALLLGRGVTLPAAAVTAALEVGSASAAVPVALFDSTLHAGILLAAGEAAVPGSFSPAVASLAHEVARGLLWERLRAGTLLLACSLLLTGSGWLTYRAIAQTVAVAQADDTPPSAADEAERFAQAHRLLLPQPGEARWREVPWLTSLREARRRAAAEGKPIFLVVAGKDSPLGPCSWNGRLFRTPSAWTDERLQLIRDHFVPVAAVGDLLMKRQDAEGTFIRDVCQLKFNTPAGYIVCLTANGKVLGKDPVPAWQAFRQLPAAEQFATLPADEAVDASCEWPSPPADGLVLRIYARPLGRDASGALRHARADEFVQVGPVTDDLQIKLQPSPDHLWLRRAEAQQLVPAQPRVGATYPVPATLVRRLCCYHLVPARIYNSTGEWASHQLRAGDLRLRVEAVTDELLHLRLEGQAQLGAVYDPATPLEEHALGYEAQLFGWLTYDRRRQAFTRFEVTALGDVYGRMPFGSNNPLHGAVRPGRAPLGFAFQLIEPTGPADRIPPTGRYRKEYFANDSE
ncbi:MAG: RNA polymerase sigma factor, partial [Planctomycetia bacterium]|nr:RNA polymerase sigma factor [Planctomycetia bacterium]